MRRVRVLGALVALAFLVAACGADDDEGAADDGPAGEEPAGDADEADGEGGTLTIYSGRSEELVGPVIEMFEEETGITVKTRYGDTAEMAAAILEEGDNSPADVFFGQDAGALGQLADEGRLAGLDAEILDVVDEQYRSAEGEWVGVTGRARTVVYNTETLTEDDLPDSILDFTSEEWAGGRIGWAPTNGSFQAFVTALRELEGEDGARAWLEGIQANGARVYDGNKPIVEAVAAGEIDVGFVNHYYALGLQAEDPDFAATNKYYTEGAGALVNVAGGGIVDTADEPALAADFLTYLLSEEAQEYFATETYEIPLVEGIETSESVPEFADLEPPDLDLSDLDDLEGTLTLLTDVGLV